MRRILALLLAAALLVLPVRAAEGTKYVALTFDDGPSGKYTRQLLDGLYDRGVKATFLLCGYRIKDYPDITQRIFDEGHEIGYHGYSHQNMSQMSRRDIAAEIMDTQALLPEGCDPVFLRPPGGPGKTACQPELVGGPPGLGHPRHRRHRTGRAEKREGRGHCAAA